MLQRRMGRSGIEVSAVGMGCWAIGGPFWRDGKPVGWGRTDDAESVRALRRAADLGVALFDTADVYGCGHSETLVGRALADCREKVVIATKVGHTFEEGSGRMDGPRADPSYIRSRCDGSLRRLDTDYIDLYQLHVGDLAPADGAVVRDVFEDLVAAGKVRWYGWSTDDPERARVFADGEHCTAVQQRLNLFEGNHETLGVCEANDLASLNRSPLAMGLLTGKFGFDTKLGDDDIRCEWDFASGVRAEQLRKLDQLRDVLTAGGRTLAQGALCWLLARSDHTLPIPGFKTVAQVEENAGACAFGPLGEAEMRQIQEVLA